LNNDLLGLQVYEWRRALSRGRAERLEYRTPRRVGFPPPGGAAQAILLRKEYGCVVAEPGAETWPIQVIKVRDEPHEEFGYRGACDIQIHSSLERGSALRDATMPPGGGGGGHQL
jgi:hypothetical protein